MKTAKEIYDYGVQNGFIGREIKEKGSLANLQYILDSLDDSEDVLLGFNGELNRTSMTKVEGIYSFVLTGKRLVWGAKSFGRTELQSLNLDNVEHLSFAKHRPFTNFGLITIDTVAKQYNISMGVKPAEALNPVLTNMINDLKASKNEPAVVAAAAPSAADEILKFKNLLDMGVITQEEFELKKKELLRL